MRSFKYILVLLTIGLFTSFKKDEVPLLRVENLRTELLVNPIGIDVREPRFSWKVPVSARGTEQKAYQILVASSLEKLNANEGDLWNPGRVSSKESIYIKYAGKPLKSRDKAYWKVKIWTNNGFSDWSAPAYYSMGLLHYKDW